MRSARRLLGVIAVLVLVVAACGNDTSSSTSSASSSSSSSTSSTSSTSTTSAPPGDEATSDDVEVVTYNAGLAAGFVDYASERAPLVQGAVGELDADVVFVQEVWTDADVAALTDAVEERYPHSSFLDPMPDEVDGGDEPAIACPLDEALPLEECARARCADVPADQLADCVLSGCGVEFAATCPDCQACLAANVGSTIDEAITACTQGSAAYAYGGAFGIGFLSAAAFVAQDSLVLDSSLTRRAVLYAQVDDPALGALHLFGTHLSPVFTDVPYPGEGSWEAEQAAQIETLRQWIDEKTAGEGTVVLLGDFNTGPGGARYEPEVEPNYDALVAGGWVNAYSEALGPDAECTFCTANPLIGGGGDSGVLIDHVLVLRYDGAFTAERILDQSIEIEVDGNPVPTALSDHYGVRAVLTLDG